MRGCYRVAMQIIGLKNMKSGMCYRSDQRLVLVVLCLTIFGCTPSSASPNLYDSFKDYRTVISEDQRNCFRFFSSNMLREAMDSILYSWEPVPTVTLERTRGLFLSGGKVEIVHEFFVSRIEERLYYLDIRYSNTQEEGLRRLGVFYVEQGGRYFINSFDYYLDSLGEIPSTVVDDFSNLKIPNVREVLIIEEMASPSPD